MKENNQENLFEKIKKINEKEKQEQAEKERAEREQIQKREKIIREEYEKRIRELIDIKKPTRELLQTLIDKIEIDKDKNIEIFYRFMI